MSKALLRIGFVDDDLDDHLLFVKAVRSYYRIPVIDCFTDIDEMIYFYTRKGNIPPHILFLDKNMPGNYNYEGLVNIKGHPLINDVPVVIYSTSDNEHEINEALKVGAASFITKPTGLQAIVERLRDAIETFVDHKIQLQEMGENRA